MLREAHDEWQVSDWRYLSEESMAELYKNPALDTKELEGKESDTPDIIDQPLPAAA